MFPLALLCIFSSVTYMILLYLVDHRAFISFHSFRMNRRSAAPGTSDDVAGCRVIHNLVLAIRAESDEVVYCARHLRVLYTHIMGGNKDILFEN